MLYLLKEGCHSRHFASLRYTPPSIYELLHPFYRMTQAALRDTIIGSS